MDDACARLRNFRGRKCRSITVSCRGGVGRGNRVFQHFSFCDAVRSVATPVVALLFLGPTSDLGPRANIHCI